MTIPRTVAVGSAAIAVAVGAWLAESPPWGARDAVVAVKTIDRGSVIDNHDVERTSRQDTQGVAGEVEDVVGRVALTTIDRGTPVGIADVVAEGLVDGRVPVTVTAAAGADGPVPGDRATVLVSPRQAGPKGLVLADVPVLRAEEAGTGTEYTLAVLPEDLEDLADLLGMSDVLVTRPY